MHLIWLKSLNAWIAQKCAADALLGASGIGLAGASVAFAAYMIAHNDAGPRINEADKMGIFAKPASAPYNGGGARSLRGGFDFTPTGTVRARTGAMHAAPNEKLVVGYSMRGYSQGEALVQGPDGFLNVRVGDEIEGLGRVTAIEGRGRSIFVITTGGTIGGDD